MLTDRPSVQSIARDAARGATYRHENGGEKVDHGSGGISPLRAA